MLQSESDKAFRDFWCQTPELYEKCMSKYIVSFYKCAQRRFKMQVRVVLFTQNEENDYYVKDDRETRTTNFRIARVSI